MKTFKIAIVCVIVLLIIAAVRYAMPSWSAPASSDASLAATSSPDAGPLNPAPKITITSPVGVAYWNQNTDGEWTWTSSPDVKNVAIYLRTATATLPFSLSYPNEGHFWWAVGFAQSDWSGFTRMPNGTYEIDVCPEGTQEIDATSCGEFQAVVGGTVPQVQILAPQEGETYSPGQNIAVTFSGAQIGDVYETYLSQPAKGADITYDLGVIHATLPAYQNGIPTQQTISFVVPRNTAPGNYKVEIVQTSNNKSPCVNACALASSGWITIGK